MKLFKKKKKLCFLQLASQQSNNGTFFCTSICGKILLTNFEIQNTGCMYYYKNHIHLKASSSIAQQHQSTTLYRITNHLGTKS